MDRRTRPKELRTNVHSGAPSDPKHPKLRELQFWDAKPPVHNESSKDENRKENTLIIDDKQLVPILRNTNIRYRFDPRHDKATDIRLLHWESRQPVAEEGVVVGEKLNITVLFCLGKDELVVEDHFPPGLTYPPFWPEDDTGIYTDSDAVAAWRIRLRRELAMPRTADTKPIRSPYETATHTKTISFVLPKPHFSSPDLSDGNSSMTSTSDHKKVQSYSYTLYSRKLPLSKVDILMWDLIIKTQTEPWEGWESVASS